MPRFDDDAIVLRVMAWSESSQIATLFTRERGKVRGLAKGSRRASPSSVQRFTGGFELLTLGRVTATIRPSVDLAAITEWDLAESMPHLRRSLVGQRIGCVAASYVDAMTAEEDPHPVLFDALLGLLGGLAGGVPAEPAGSEGLLAFQWALLRETGYALNLTTDARTGGPLGEGGRLTFDPRAGGFTAERGDDRWRVRAETLAILREAAGGGATPQAAGTGRGVASRGVEGVVRANRLLTSYLRELLGREVPTMGLVLKG
jgi:DNA repair protein RecO (recombination protein O)